MANPHLTATGQPWWPSTYSSPIPAKPAVTNQVSPGHPGGGYQPDLNPPVVTQPLPPQNNNDNIVTTSNVSTGTGVDDLKVQAKQKRVEDERKNYQDKLIALASSGMSSPGPLMHGLDFSFGGKMDPTLGFIPSGDVPTSDFQKALFLAQHDIGKPTEIFYDEDKNVISPTDAYFSGEEGIAGLGKVVTDEETGKKSFKKTGVGDYILGDVWNEALDPGGLHPDPDNPYWSGDIMADYFKNAYDDYYDFDQSWSGMDDFDYAFYGGPQETASLSDPNWWKQRSLGELDPTGFSNLEQIYGEELTNRMAAPHSWGIEPFSEIITEIT